MKSILTGLVAAGLLAGFAGTSGADSNDRKQRRVDSQYGSYSTMTERQRKNLKAYERGEYYERDSNALPVGSRPWFEQKERESGERR